MAKKDNIDKYLDKIIEIPRKENSDENNSAKQNDKKDSDRLKDAFDFANSCRDKEIDRFWSRGAYFWAFIAASFGAYMALFSASLEDENKISLEQIEEILSSKGKTTRYEHNHKFFNSGKTDFNDHKEFLFITEVR